MIAMKQTFLLIDPRVLIATEETDHLRLEEVQHMILEAGTWRQPIVVADDVPLVMDGHHRLATALTLGLDFVPAVRVPYSDIEVRGWKDGTTFDKEAIYRAAREHRLLPPKTTRHTFPPELCLRCDIPLAILGLKANGRFFGGQFAGRSVLHGEA
ncbi:hypothetical protein [Rhizobium sp. BT-175]|uniref:hypothetical protein n=1 Tax=Rhizobium sp. BT-175 TaxID=2986929 RepID=UPI0022358253|nr:hypothetical protein [Rhizobium sp. BT-175]MCV9947665.1 hypothetical protein [Rhizobium sp. BT-175]